jgi:hypothetical protein
VIITRLKGGLGNQLFQYAAGFRLASIRNTELKLDLSEFDNPNYRTPRSYELGVFKVTAEPVSAHDEASISTSAGPAFRRWLPERFRPRSSTAAIERHFQFDPAVLSLPGDVIMDGYWQSERYFADVSDLVREEFSLKQCAAGRNAEMAAEIAGCNAVSLHVRRGDYAADSVVMATHGVCPLDYYDRAVDYVVERVSNPAFFVFSDDPDWVREHLELRGSVEVVDHNGPDACSEDLRLMSRCVHHIIANSTFSWWGAWLNSSPDKIVVAPSRWFADDSLNTSDLLPASWVKL